MQLLWFAILQAQIETGTPYMLYKDACNRKSTSAESTTLMANNYSVGFAVTSTRSWDF